MARERYRQRSIGMMAWLSILLIVGLAVFWMFMPTESMESTWLDERQKFTWANAPADHMIAGRVERMMDMIAKEPFRITSTLSGSAAERWLADRIHVIIIWARLALYRAHALLMWLVLGFPFVLASAMDGVYTREMRKTAFISQSPINLRLGVRTFYLGCIGLIVWVCLPISMPIFFAPLMILVMATAIWLWVGHLQKRL